MKPYLLLHELRRKAEQAITPASIDDLFSSVPYGDFKWDDSEAGEWLPWYCDDCHKWHKVAYGLELGRNEGKLYAVIRSVDEDGNWDFEDYWNEGDHKETDAEFCQSLRVIHCYYTSLAWIDYLMQQVMEYGTDPLKYYTDGKPSRARARKDARTELLEISGRI